MRTCAHHAQVEGNFRLRWLFRLGALFGYHRMARPPPPVPAGTLLYGEEGYSMGTRVRAPRYGIR